MRGAPLRDRVDPNDLAHVRRLGFAPIGAVAAPQAHDGRHSHVTEFLNPDGSRTAVFHVKPVYYQTREGFWRPLGEVALCHGNADISLDPATLHWLSLGYLAWLARRQAELGSELVIGEADYAGLQPRHLITALSTGTYYPDENVSGGTTTIDGGISKTGAATWASTVGAASATVQTQSQDSSCVRILGAGDGTNWSHNIRFLMLFDTSSIGIPPVVSGATVSLYSTVKDDSASITPNVNIYATTPAGNTSLTGTDYAQFGSTAFATAISYAGWSINQYNDFALNASGRAAISQTGVTKFGARNANYDAAASTPGTNNGLTSQLAIFTAHTSGTAFDPKLVVTFARPLSAQAIVIG